MNHLEVDSLVKVSAKDVANAVSGSHPVVVNGLQVVSAAQSGVVNVAIVIKVDCNIVGLLSVERYGEKYIESLEYIYVYKILTINSSG